MAVRRLVIVVGPKDVFVNRRLALRCGRVVVADQLILIEVLVDDEGQMHYETDDESDDQ